MDTTLYLKRNLISRIQSSTDENFLKALQTIFDCTEQELFKLNNAQKQSIETGRKDIANGQFKTKEQFKDDMTEWLKKQ